MRMFIEVNLNFVRMLREYLRQRLDTIEAHSPDYSEDLAHEARTLIYLLDYLQ